MAGQFGSEYKQKNMATNKASLRDIRCSIVQRLVDGFRNTKMQQKRPDPKFYATFIIRLPMKQDGNQEGKDFFQSGTKNYN